MRYFIKKQIVDENDRLIADLQEDEEIDADEVIDTLAQENDEGGVDRAREPKKKKAGRPDTGPYAKPKTEKKKGKNKCGLCGQSGHTKPTCPTAKLSPTPEKVGEREIDKQPDRVSEAHFEEIKTQLNEGETTEIIKFSYPQYSPHQIAQVKNFETYEDYIKG